MIGVLDYGFGNIKSIINIIHHVGGEVVIVRSPEEISAIDTLLLPGVGHFKKAMSVLEEKGLVEPIKNHARSGKYLVGICLGMQLMLEFSEEGNCEGLGLVKGRVCQFSQNHSLKSINMGWSKVVVNRSTEITKGLLPNSRFYFVHKYYVVCENEEDVLLSSTFGKEFTASFQRNNLIGFQFHPEKSHKYGMQVFKTLTEL